MAALRTIISRQEDQVIGWSTYGGPAVKISGTAVQTRPDLETITWADGKVERRRIQ